MAISAYGPAGGSSGAPVTSCTRIRQPPSGAGPAPAMSPPRLARTPHASCWAVGGAACAGAQGADLGVGAEPAAGRVHLGQVGFEHVAGPGQGAGFGHHQLDQRAESAPAGLCGLAGLPRRGGVPGGVRHHDPPDVAWLLPELDDGEGPELRPDELELEEPERELLLEPELELP